MAGADGMSDGAKERAGGGQEAESAPRVERGAAKLKLLMMDFFALVPRRASERQR